MICNEKKTKAMLATGKWIEKRMNNQQLQVKLNTTELKQVSSQKLLGVTIDQRLSFDDHIDELCNKLCQRIAVVRKMKESVLQHHDKANNAVCPQCMVRVLHWEFAEGFSSPEAKCKHNTFYLYYLIFIYLSSYFTY